jgi:anti-anti-sigma factor
MKLDVEHISGIAVLSVKEWLTGDESDGLVSTVRQILENGTCKFVVDLSEMEKIDSVGIESLLKAYTVVAEKNGRLAVVLPSTFLNTHL